MSWKIKEIVLITLFSIVIFVNTADFLEDGINQEDAWLKLLTIGLSFWGIIMLFRLLKHRSNEILVLHDKVTETENNLDLTHSKLKQIGREYSKYLHKQFDTWALSPSEREIAIILLKGLSFKEMAEIRNTKEKTIRQQASMIYKKSKVSGRHEFSAWFFEDMLV
jgi:DNA-binding CsgD family transcriptional regulator